MLGLPQITTDLGAYWEAVNCGMETLQTTFTEYEACFLIDTLKNLFWEMLKLSDTVQDQVVAHIKKTVPSKKYKNIVNPDEVVKKLEGLNMIELLALLDMTRIAQRSNQKTSRHAIEFIKE